MAGEGSNMSSLQATTQFRQLVDEVQQSTSKGLDTLVGRLKGLSVALTEIDLHNKSKFMELFCEAVISQSILFPSLHTIKLDNVCRGLIILLASDHLPSLKTLHLKDDKFGDEGAKALATAIEGGRLQSLEILDLANCRIRDEGLIALADALRSGQLLGLRTLNLRYNKIGHEGAKALAIQGGRLQSLEILDLFNCGIGDEGLIALADALRSGQLLGLRTLNLPYNTIGHEGAKALATAIKGGRLQSLEILNLKHCLIGDEGLIALADALRSGQLLGLRTLNLRCNKIGHEGAKALATAIQGGLLQSLEILDLYRCPIGDEGLVALTKACESGGLKSLVSFRLAYIEIGDEGLVELAKVLRRRCLPNLRELYLWAIDFSKTSVAAFKEAFAFNQDLVVTIFTKGSSFNAVQKLRERNMNLASMFKQLRGEREVPASHGKVFLCGDERQGKTTLRKTLQKKVLPPVLALFTRERTHRTEAPTRGIQVSVIVKKGTHDEVPLTIAIWDLAGQREYYTLHSTFLTDLALADGKATTFVIVCDAKRTSRSSSGLNYWLRFIASSSRRGEEDGKRHVLVVLNRFNDKPLTTTEEEAWKLDVKTFRGKFGDYLHIHAHPFIVDARVRMEVRDLKNHLLTQTAQRLKDKRMPEICQYLANEVRVDVSLRTDFPVVTLGAFLDLHRPRYSVSDGKLQAALEYLHECGRLIYFREGSLSEGADPQRSLVVLDPDYFCQKVVGYLLLPERILEDDDNPLSRRMGGDGSIQLSEMIEHLPLTMAQVQDLVSILMSLGLCYKVGNEKVLIPALVEKVGIPNDWLVLEMIADDLWVMGFCLKVLHSETSIIPISVFRRLQVELALDDMCSNFSDSCYAVGKFHIAFRYNTMTVLVEFSDLEDRVDFLVKPLVDDIDARDRRACQVDLAHTLLVKLISLAETWCSGVEFEQFIVRPWFAGERTLPMLERNINMSVQELKRRVERCGVGEKLNWPMGGHDCVMAIELLSGEDVGDLEEKRANLIEEASEKLGLTPRHEDGPFDEHKETSIIQNLRSLSDVPTKSQTNERVSQDMHTELSREIWAAKNSLKTHVDKGMQAIRNDFKIAQDRQRKILHKIQALHVFSVEEKLMSVPRFVYLTKSNDASKTWVRLRLAELFRENFMLHFLCEANHSLHEIKGQQGMQIRNLKEWAEKMAPWVEWSLRAAFVIGNIASQAVLPGLSQLLSTFPSGGGVQNVASVGITVGYLCSAASIATGGETSFGRLKNSLDLKGSNALRPLEAKESLKDTLRGLIGELPPGEFHRKFNLKRVVLKKSGNVIWICDDCRNSYQKSYSVDEL